MIDQLKQQEAAGNQNYSFNTYKADNRMWFGVKQQCLSITKSRFGLTYRVSMMQNSGGGGQRDARVVQSAALCTHVATGSHEPSWANYLGACP